MLLSRVQDLSLTKGERNKALHSLHKPLRDGGLEHVVDRTCLERFDCMLVVGRDEHDMAAPGNMPCDFDAAEQRHANIQECDVRCVRLDGA